MPSITSYKKFPSRRIDMASTLVVVVLTAIVVFTVAIIFSYSVNAVRSFMFRYEVAGMVEAVPQGKTFGSAESGMTTKFSVRLQTPTGTSIVNCTSTQCASLSLGDEVTLSCYNEWNGFVQPTEVECRFKALITVAPAKTLEHEK